MAQTMHLSCAEINTISKQNQNKLQLHPCQLGVPSGATNMISESMVHSMETVHLSCAKINTMSKLTETSFHLIHVT
jgi:hypothetical protein